MELRRTFLIVAMAVVGYFLLISWQHDYGAGSKAVDSEQTAAVTNSADAPSTPVAPEAAGKGDAPVAPRTQVGSENMTADTAQVARQIRVKTDVLDLDIDLAGGDIVGLDLLKYGKTADGKEPFTLLQNSSAHTYVARSGLIGEGAPDNNWANRPIYSTAANLYEMQPGQDTLSVVLELAMDNQVKVQKIFQFTRGSHLINISYRVTNDSSTPWHGIMVGDIKRDSSKDPSKESKGFGLSTFLGGAWGTPEKAYNKRTFTGGLFANSFEEKPLKDEKAKGGWIAMVQHYFVSAWVPDKNVEATLSTQVDNGFYYVRFMTPYVTAQPGQTVTLKADFYAGPKIQRVLEKIAPGLELTLDYGWLWFIAQGLFWLLLKIQSVVGNWGWAIVILTILVKAAFFKLSATSYKSMAHMRRVTPEIQRIREQYANDRAKMSQAMMDLYKKEKINPLGGCLPILVQMPVFIALYYCLMESIELRHAPWILWIKDLSVMDPHFILPLIMGGSMYVQALLNPAPADPMQARVMKLMPIVFTFMFLWFPAGLVLYWVVNNLLSIAQQAIITRQIAKAETKRA